MPLLVLRRGYCVWLTNKGPEPTPVGELQNHRYPFKVGGGKELRIFKEDAVHEKERY